MLGPSRDDSSMPAFGSGAVDCRRAGLIARLMPPIAVRSVWPMRRQNPPRTDLGITTELAFEFLVRSRMVIAVKLDES
jgi:hypothetical protein